MSAAEKKDRSHGPRIEGGTLAGRLWAAAILEVLAGMRTPTAAAKALGVGVPRYYAREARALEALVHACEPRGHKGRTRSPVREAERLRREVERLTRECARRQALVRAASKAAGLSAVPAAKKAPGGKRRRKPTVRALKAAGVLRSTPEASVEDEAPPSS
jgi:hypothetical protein